MDASNRPSERTSYIQPEPALPMQIFAFCIEMVNAGQQPAVFSIVAVDPNAKLKRTVQIRAGPRSC
jgi:hypothetical protein